DVELDARAGPRGSLQTIVVRRDDLRLVERVEREAGGDGDDRDAARDRGRAGEVVAPAQRAVVLVSLGGRERRRRRALVGERLRLALPRDREAREHAAGEDAGRADAERGPRGDATARGREHGGEVDGSVARHLDDLAEGLVAGERDGDEVRAGLDGDRLRE